ncbi:MAG: hypothetical protein Q9227_008998 [Pyrenula ochraceoflavens]
MPLEAIRYNSLPRPSLQILDQLLLPHVESYFSVPTSAAGHAAIKSMRVRGAPAIAMVAALSLAVELSDLLEGGKLSDDAEEVAVFVREKLEFLKGSRPTAVNLGEAVGRLGRLVDRVGKEQGKRGSDVVRAYAVAAEKMLESDVRDNERIGEWGADWVLKKTEVGKTRKGDRVKVLTHCNTGSLATAGYGTALGIIRALHAHGTLAHAYCTETRPYNQGARLTAYELVHDKIPSTLIADSMAGALLHKEAGRIAAVVVGADRVAANGDTANKIGTYSLAVLAKFHGVKFLVAAPRTTIDMKTKSGEEIVVEERAKPEVTHIKGPRAEGGQVDVESAVTISIAAPGIDVWNPAFDVTPAQLIDGIATEVGVVEKDDNGQFNLGSIFQSDSH